MKVCGRLKSVIRIVWALVFGAVIMASLSLPALGLCIKVSRAHLRKSPGKKSPISWVVGKYTPLKEIKARGPWIQVSDVDGQRHWVHKSLISYGMSCLTVRVSKTSLRTGPGVKFKRSRFYSASKYSSYKKLDREEHWFKVVDEYGEISYIYDNNVWRPMRSVNISF